MDISLIRLSLAHAVRAGKILFLGIFHKDITIWNTEEEPLLSKRAIAINKQTYWFLPEDQPDTEELRSLLYLVEASLPKEMRELNPSPRVSESRDLLLKLTDRSPGAFFQFEKRPDGSLAFPFMSVGIEEIHPGLTAEALQADPRLGFSQMHPDDLPEIMQKLSQSYRELSHWDYEFRVVQGDKTVWHRALAQPERKEDGTVVWYGSFQDITEQKNRYFALQAKNEQLREIAWLQSHVIRAPVARLMGLVEVMELDSVTDEERSMMMEAILASAHEIDAVVKDIVAKTGSNEGE